MKIKIKKQNKLKSIIYNFYKKMKDLKKYILVIFIIAILFTIISSKKLSKSILKAENDKKIKIMCIGDSITDGYGTPGSYRKFLYNGLTKKGYSIDMVGSKSGWSTTYTDETTGESFDFDDDNTGYSAYTIKSYGGRNGIYETLKETDCLSQKPDIVILQIGTNNVIDRHDAEENSKDYDILLDYILENIPSTSMLFITTIPDVDPNRNDVYSWFANYRHSPDWQTLYSDEEAESAVKLFLKMFNSDITSKAKKRKELGQNIRGADVNSAITDVKTQLKDGVHPNDIGFKAMGEYWTEIIDSYLKELK